MRLFYCITTLVVCPCFDVLEFRCGWLEWYPCGRLQAATGIPLQPNHTETPTHIETRTHNQCGDTIEKSQAPDDGCINVRNMFTIEEVKQNLINCDSNLIPYSSTITMMHGPIYINLSVSSSIILQDIPGL